MGLNLNCNQSVKRIFKYKFSNPPISEKNKHYLVFSPQNVLYTNQCSATRRQIDWRFHDNHHNRTCDNAQAAGRIAILFPIHRNSHRDPHPANTCQTLHPVNKQAGVERKWGWKKIKTSTQFVFGQVPVSQDIMSKHAQQYIPCTNSTF